MAEGQFCEEIPYLKWKINDVDSWQMFKSPSFTIKGVKFRAVYHHVISSELYEIYMEPEVGDSMLTIPAYSITASVSIVSQNKEHRGLRFTQHSLSINPNSKGNGLRHVLWLLRKKELLSIRDKIVGGNGMNDVTFLCVFGQRSNYQKDVFDEEGTWCKKQCFLRLGMDLYKLRSIPDSYILLKSGKDEIKANAFIISARSETFADKVRRDMISANKSDVNIKIRRLANFITYLYTGLLIDSKPTPSVLTELCRMANMYKVDSLAKMLSFKLLECMNEPIFVCDCGIRNKELYKEELSSGIVREVEGLPAHLHIVEKYKFGLGYHSRGLVYFAREVLDILLNAAYLNETCTKKIIYSIAKDYDFVLYTWEWEEFCKRYSSEFISEVYRVFFQYVKKYRPRR